MASNYTEFTVGSIIYLRSYKSIVAKWDNDKYILTLGKDWNYSMTTVTHIGVFVSKLPMQRFHGRNQFQKAIDNGSILYDPEMK